ncbi:hypothetical protein BJY16_007169 [Actinoplanes octamycinicus]|uniref:Thioesterase superfamily protein n=1 Tax=Actinoplanes octamycinicus TaxID=135948 RepID=A0A7W7H483_9ACTN|nr:hypothetical protein [Actinoplanes octamycinicus]MBB4743710.1 hypothetical protein [Actinoplanes octamycinicus]GIE61138.1 hypothetical protein Aoc01nite_65400 [Actinoplanes octamycinicus]
MPDYDIVIDPAFEGPPGSAHGGYACGILAAHLPSDVEITLRRPVPLGTRLRLTPQDQTLSLYDGSELLAEGVTTRIDFGTPEPPTYAEALGAGVAFPGFRAHPYPGCVGCGTARTDAAALRIFPGPVPGRDLVAAVWHPEQVRPPLLWAALDCPGGWAAAHFGRVTGPAVLGRMAARLAAPLVPQSAYIVVGWLEAAEGRKLIAGSALFSRDGVLRGAARQTWIRLSGAAVPAEAAGVAA